IMVGALFVSGIETTWHGEVSPPHGAELLHQEYPADDSPPMFSRGDEIGRFNMGSTVILLFEKNTLDWAKTLAPGGPLRMGACLATARASEQNKYQ
ncbi:MAG: phosphatidylserine decarboxylase, partial [Thiohalomonadales bacterium]